MSAGEGSHTAPRGTPLAVDVTRDRRQRVVTGVFLAGPVIWSAHFLLVYAVAEAGCTGDGPGLALFDPPVPVVVTLVATAVAALACLATAWWAYRRWRPNRTGAETSDLEQAEGEGGDPGGTMALAGLMLSLLSFVAVLFDGVPALFLGC